MSEATKERKELNPPAGSVLSVSEVKDYGEFWQTAIEAAIDFGRVSETLFQRHCRIGYNRARRMTDKMRSLGWIKRGETMWEFTERFPSPNS